MRCTCIHCSKAATLGREVCPDEKLPGFLSHKGAIEFPRPAWVKRWPFLSDHTGSASINTGERAERWQPVPWSGSSGLWLEARRQKLLLNLFTPPSWSSRRSQRQRHLWKRERCAALLKHARAHARAERPGVCSTWLLCPLLLSPQEEPKEVEKTAQDALTFLPNNRKALCFCSQLPFPLFV